MPAAALVAPLALATLLLSGLSAASAPGAAPAECVATSASWQWGFKESFRAYVSGSIAQGEWRTSGEVGYETPAFFAEAAKGELRLESLTGELAVDGGMRFTGHAGILDTTIDDIRLQWDGAESFTIVADVVGTTQDFEEVDAADVRFLEGDLAAAQWAVEGGALIVAQIPLTLTAAGAEAFGTYPEGEGFDPMTVRVPTSEPCAEQALAARNAASSVGIVPWVLLGAGVAVAVASVVLVRRRQRSTVSDTPRSAGQESGA